MVRVSVRMFRSLTPMESPIPGVLPSVLPPLNLRQSRVCFPLHLASGDDSLGPLRFRLGRIRAGRLLIIRRRLGSVRLFEESSGA